MKGFTLIEVIVAVAISMMVTGFILVNYNSYNDVQTLKQAALTLKNNLRFAQSKALTGEKPADCDESDTLLGYTFSITDASTYTIQAQCDSGPEGTILSTSMPHGVTFSSAPISFLFGVLSRGTDLSAETSIQLSGSGKTYVIQVSPGGDISDLGIQ